MDSGCVYAHLVANSNQKWVLWRKVQENIPQKTERKTSPRPTCVKTQFFFKILMLENKPKLQDVHF